ncbi:MAG: hypothetical protein AAB740_01100, partial [Patescibacteria group bacterium]
MKRVIVVLIVLIVGIMGAGFADPPGAYFKPLPDGLKIIEAHPKMWGGPFGVVCYNEEGKECSRPFAIQVESGTADIDIRIEKGKGEFYLMPLGYGYIALRVSLLHEDVSRAYGYPTLATSKITFVNLVSGKINTIKIYSSMGELVKVIETMEESVEWN